MNSLDFEVNVKSQGHDQTKKVEAHASTAPSRVPSCSFVLMRFNPFTADPAKALHFAILV